MWDFGWFYPWENSGILRKTGFRGIQGVFQEILVQLNGDNMAGWWFGTMEFYDFPETVGNLYIMKVQYWGLEHFLFSIYWEFHHPNWRTSSFFRGVGITPTRWRYYGISAIFFEQIKCLSTPFMALGNMMINQWISGYTVLGQTHVITNVNNRKLILNRLTMEVWWERHT